MFLGDSSGLDAQQTADGVLLWAVDNGTGPFWKLVASADGTVAFADGWERASVRASSATPITPARRGLTPRASRSTPLGASTSPQSATTRTRP